MDDLLVLLLFILVPFVSGTLAGLFFFKFKVHRRKLTLHRLLIGNLLVLLAVGSTALLMGELYYRFVHDTTDSFGLTKSTTRWVERHVQTNNLGFRDSVPYARSVPPGQRRVTFIGDSFVAGHGIDDVEDRFTNLLRDDLDGVEVHAIAQPGWDTSHQLACLKVLKDHGYHLDDVVLIYCLNDLSDLVPEWQEIRERIYDSYRPGYLFDHSYLLNVWYYRWKLAHDPDLANYYEFILDNYDGPVWDEQRRRLKEMNDLVEGGGGRLLVVTFPFLHTLGTDDPCQDIHQCLDEFWTTLGVPHLDLHDTLDSYPPDELVVNRHDPHPNEFANELAADAIAEFLKQHQRR